MKYDVCVLAVFKNEASFLPEWIDHYLNRNVDHIYLLNDRSTDNSLDVIPKSDKITILHTNDEDAEYDKHWRQEYLYNKYYHYIIQECKWLGVFDLDEFCYSPQEIDFKKLLFYFDKTNFQELIIDWYWFGSNGYEDQPEQIVNSFIKRASLPSKIICRNWPMEKGYHWEWCCKSFAKTKSISNISHHYNKFNFYNKNDYKSIGRNKLFCKNLSDDGIAYINHYIGSKNYYFQNKVIRGSCNNNSYLQKNKAELYREINLNEIIDITLKNQNI